MLRPSLGCKMLVRVSTWEGRVEGTEEVECSAAQQRLRELLHGAEMASPFSLVSRLGHQMQVSPDALCHRGQPWRSWHWRLSAEHTPQQVPPGRESERPLPQPRKPRGFLPSLGLLIIGNDFSQSDSRWLCFCFPGIVFSEDRPWEGDNLGLLYI